MEGWVDRLMDEGWKDEWIKAWMDRWVGSRMAG